MGRYKTPLRYPGGKQRLTPFVREVLACNGGATNYVEPYAGGAGVAMELLLSRDVRHVYLNDSSRNIFAFWHSVKFDAENLCRLISRASLSLNEWSRQREIAQTADQHDLLTLGFSTFYLNRCNRSGVLTAGVIGGKNQDGRWRIDARFSRNELISRIEAIAAKSDQISVSNLDAEKFIVRKVNALRASTLVYCDPPYYERAKRLYLNTYEPDDHARVAKLIKSKLRHPWLVSYDAHVHIQQLYKHHRKFVYTIQYSAIKSCPGREVFIFSDRMAIPRESVLPYISCALASARR